ncbi:MAG TPA: haloacid dehalogenase [Flavobacteriales bacterium]|jgi:phosphoserine phosphatase|nr:haloacid dehalogenase [Flavobacteriales bacterium]
MFRLTLIIVLAAIAFSCQEPESNLKEKNKKFIFHDPLESWNDGKNKRDIINFVLSTSHKDSANYIPEADRIAVFDNDGTLWSEQPLYFQVFFAVYQIKKMAEDHPEWKENEPFKSVLDEGIKALGHMDMKDLVEIIMVTHANMTSVQFQAEVESWLKADRHPTLNRPFDQLVYQPMLELIEFLKAYQFKVFIVSGGGQDFIRPWATEVYGIPSYQIIGSSIKTSYEVVDGVPTIKRLSEMDFIDDKEGKPVGIYRQIGIKPVICVGNSDGDLQMMEWTHSNAYSSLKIYVHHTDSVREWAYDRDSHIGKFDVALDRALNENWTLIDMAKDWNRIYPFEPEK